jgi:hypothetical protein
VRKIVPADPRQRLIDSHRRSVDQLAATRITLYGLPSSWHGRRYLASTCFEHGVECGRTDIDHQTVELGHDDGHGGYLGVTSSDHPSEPPADGFDAVIAIDRVPLLFRATRSRHEVIARRTESGLTITVTARHWPIANLVLERVTDPGPYLDGRKVMLEARSGFRLD